MKKLIIELENNKFEYRNMTNFELARFFTKINEGRKFLGHEDCGCSVQFDINDIENVKVIDESGNIEFYKEYKDKYDEKFIEVVEQISNDLDYFVDFAEILEKRYPFLEIEINYKIDESRIDDYVSSKLND